MDLDIEKAARNFKKWSLYRLAIEIGVPNQLVYCWKSGKIIPSISSLQKICEALNCTPNDLFRL